MNQSMSNNSMEGLIKSMNELCWLTWLVSKFVIINIIINIDLSYLAAYIGLVIDSWIANAFWPVCMHH